MLNAEKSLLRQFKQALRYGSGKAFLMLRAHPELPVDELLLEAAMRNAEYDPQCNGNHATYIDDLLELRPNYGGLIREIARRFEFDATLSAHDARQVYELLGWSEEADAEVVAIIHRRFVRRHREEAGAGFMSIARTEGMPGIMFLAQVVGASLLAAPVMIPAGNRIWAAVDEWLTWFPVLLDELGIGGNWREELAATAEGDAAVRCFLNAVEKCDAESAVLPRAWNSPCGMEELEGVLRRREFISRVCFKLSRVELAELRRRLRMETDPMRLASICKVLYCVKGGVTASLFPRLVTLARSRNRCLAVNAIDALGVLKSDRVRKFTIRELAKVTGGMEICRSTGKSLAKRG